MYTLYAQTPDDNLLFMACRYSEGWITYHAEKNFERLMQGNPKNFKALHVVGPDNKTYWSKTLIKENEG